MIILASESPQRKELLKNLGIHFEVLAPKVNENIEEPLLPSEYVTVLSKRKAASAVNICTQNTVKQATIIAADTIVYINNEILGKPKNREDAVYMLNLLKNNWHSIYTGLTVAFMKEDCIKYVQDCCITNVKFKHLTEQQIELYINIGEPFGRAGAYAIQGKGRELAEKIDGDYYNAVGLPIYNLRLILNEYPGMPL